MPTPTHVTPARVKSASFAAAARRIEELPPPVGAEIAFAGRSNVGKSSLMNSLLERRNLVRTSSTPGCTRSVSFFEARTIDDAALAFVDLPGYGYAKRSKAERGSWADLIEGYLLGRPTLGAVILLVDVRRGLEADDLDLLEMIAGPARIPRRPVETLVVATKLDKLPASQRKPALAKVQHAAGRRVVGFSAKDGTGRDELWRWIPQRRVRRRRAGRRHSVAESAAESEDPSSPASAHAAPGQALVTVKPPPGLHCQAPVSTSHCNIARFAAAHSDFAGAHQ